MSAAWDGDWLTTDELRAVRAEEADAERQAAQADRDALKLAVIAAWEAPLPRSPIGTAIAVVLGFALMVLGLVLALTLQPLSGATIAAVLLVSLGGALIVRLAQVNR